MAQSLNGVPAVGVTVTQMEIAAKAYNDKHCEIFPGTPSWAELTKDQQCLAMVILSAAFSAVPATGP